MAENSADMPSEFEIEEDGEDESLVDKLKDKLEDVLDTPEAADYDHAETNPVTGMPRTP
jgi:hypothetical protein